MDDMYFQTLNAYYSCIHKWLVSSRRLFASSYICWTAARRCALTPAECHPSRDPETNTWPWLSSAYFACVSEHRAGWVHRPERWQHSYVEDEKTSVEVLLLTSLIFFFFLISHFFKSPFSLCFTSHQHQVPVFVLPALLIPHPEWAAAATRVFSRRWG